MPVYICLISTGVGGAEKRTIELWELWQESGWSNIHLVVSRHLYDMLVRLPNLRYFAEGHPALVILECRSPISFLVPLLRLAWRAGRGAIFHYPLQGVPLIHRLMGQRMMLSYTANVFFLMYAGGWRRKAFFRLQAASADKIDVLNPLNFERFRRLRWSRDKVLLNPGSFVDLSRYRDDADKKNWIVFCGRFADGDPKNAVKFVAAIPAIQRAADAAGIRDVRFVLLGEGVLEPHLRRMLSGADYQGIDIELKFEDAPVNTLRHSRVFVSLQKGSNYPSKSLLEALACGNLPVVTDVGETRLIAHEAFSSYVSDAVAPAALAAAIVDLLRLPADVWGARVSAAREHLRRRFDISAHYDHYLEMYDLKTRANDGDDRAGNVPR